MVMFKFCHLSNSPVEFSASGTASKVYFSSIFNFFKGTSYVYHIIVCTNVIQLSLTGNWLSVNVLFNTFINRLVEASIKSTTNIYFHTSI